MKLLRGLTLGALLLLGLPTVLVGLLLTSASTESGTRWLLEAASATAQANGLALTLQHASGNLLDRVVLQDLAYRQDGVAINAGYLELAWRPRALLSGHLDIEHLGTSGLVIVIPPSEATPEPDPPSIPDIELPVRVSVSALHAERVTVQQGDFSQLIDRLDLSIKADELAIAIALHALTTPQGRIRGSIDVQTTAPHPLSAELIVVTSQALAGPAIGTIETHARLDGPALQPQVQMELIRPLQAGLSGAIMLDERAPRFDLALDWTELRWPLDSEAMFSTASGRLEVEGTADDYRLNLRTAVNAPDLPRPVTLQLEAAGSTQALAIAPLSLEIEDASVLARGDLRWLPDPAWQLELVAERLDPGLLDTAWPGDLEGTLAVSGRLGPDGALSVDLLIDRIDGVLREQPLLASGRLELRGKAWQARGLSIASGPNRVNIDGSIDEQIDAHLDIDAPDLSAAYPGLTGTLTGSGQLAGTRERPLVRADLDGRDLRFADGALDNLELTVDWRAAGGNAQLLMSGLRHGDQTLDRAQINVDGRLEDHRLQLAVEADSLKLDLAATGGYATQAWQGAINRLGIEQDLAGVWELAEPTELTLGPTRSSLGDFCLEQAPARLCGQGSWQSSGPIDLNATFDRLALGPLVARLTPNLAVESEFAGRLAVSGTMDNPVADVQLRSDAGALQVDNPELAAVTRYRALALDGSLAGDRAEAHVRFELGETGEASGTVRLGPAQDGQRTLDGELTAILPDLELVAGLVPVLEASQGRLHAAIVLGGTLAAPEVSGSFDLQDGSARLPAAGLQLEQITFSASGDASGSPIAVMGQVSSGGGLLTLEGNVALSPGEAPAIDLRLTGDEFLASDLEQALVRLSPDLTLSGAGPPYAVSGILDITSARFKVDEIPPTVITASEDEIIIDAEVEEIPATGRDAVRAALTVRLGDDISFEGFGLNTRLAGNIDFAVNERGPRVDGKIQLLDGRYKAYGQDLDIERGELLFAGPADNPDVDLRAARVSTDGSVTAYLALTGALRSPNLRVYTQPANSDTEALAYLLTGRGLSSASRDQQIDIASAALNIGLAQGEPLLQEFGNSLGLDEFAVESGEMGLQDSSLILGKYLNPDLYLGYTQGLFQPEGAVLLRLRVTEQVEVESRSGIEQSVDLFYRIEHD